MVIAFIFKLKSLATHMHSGLTLHLLWKGKEDTVMTDVSEMRMR